MKAGGRLKSKAPWQNPGARPKKGDAGKLSLSIIFISHAN